MRATLDIDADILNAAKAIAEVESKTVGQVLSELVRRGLTAVSVAPDLTGGACLSVEAENDRLAGEERMSHANDARYRR
jgi:hypothetical protein